MPSLYELYDEADKLKDEGKNEEAMAKLKEILTQDESFVLAHLAMAVISGKMGQHTEAIQHSQRACELGPDEPFHFTAMSVTYQRASQAATSQEENQRYIQLAEDSMARAHTLQSQG